MGPHPHFLIGFDVDDDLVQAGVFYGARPPPRFDGLCQHPFHACLADPFPPAGERGGIDRWAVLKEGLAGEMLVVGVLDPAGDDRLVRQPEGVLEIEQPRHEPRRRCRAACRGGEEPGPLRLEEVPVDQGRQLHQFMAHVDQVDQPGAEEIILFGRTRAVGNFAPALLRGFDPAFTPGRDE